MTTADLPTDDVSATAEDAPTCDACEHPLDAHDEIGRRFCSATVAAALSRGCICR